VAREVAAVVLGVSPADAAAVRLSGGPLSAARRCVHIGLFVVYTTADGSRLEDVGALVGVGKTAVHKIVRKVAEWRTDPRWAGAVLAAERVARLIA